MNSRKASAGAGAAGGGEGGKRYAAVICACCVLVYIVNMGMILSGFSLFFPYIREGRGYSNTGIYFMTTCRSVVSMAAMQYAARFYARVDVCRGMPAMAAVSAAGFALMALVKSSLGCYAGMCLFGVAYGLGSVIPTSILLRRWYSGNSAAAMGIAMSGCGVAGMLLPPVINLLVGSFGLEGAFAAMAAGDAVAAVLVAVLLKNPPDFEKEPQPEKGAEQGAGKGAGLSIPLAMVIAMICIGSVNITGTSSSSMLLRTEGLDMTHVSLLMSWMGLVLIVSKVLYGASADRYGGRHTAFWFGGIQASALLLLCFSGPGGSIVMAAGITLFSLGMPIGTVGLPVLAADFSTPESYTATLKDYQLMYTVGGLVSSLIPGVLADLTGSYVPAFAVFAFLAVLLLVLVLREYRKAGESSKTTAVAK